MRTFDPTILLAAATFGIALPVFAFDSKAGMQTAPPVEREIADTSPPPVVPLQDDGAALAANAMYAEIAAERRADARAAHLADADLRHLPEDLLRPARDDRDAEPGDIAADDPADDQADDGWRERVAYAPDPAGDLAARGGGAEATPG